MGRVKGREDVERAVKELGIAAELLVLKASTMTVGDAARALGVPESVIIKTLITIDKASGKAYAIIIPGDRRLDIERLRRKLNSPGLRLAKAREVERLTGFKVGGVPPVGLPPNIEVLVDREVAKKEYVFGGGGDSRTLLRIRVKDLLKLASGIIEASSEG